MISHKISINDQKNQYFRKKICMNKDSIRKNLWHSSKKSVFHLILGRKICILPNFTVKKSVYTDEIRMSGRSAYLSNVRHFSNKLSTMAMKTNI